MENNNRATFTLSRRIGSTNYRVSVCCSDAATETYEDKIFRLIRNEAMAIDGKCDIIIAPQTNRQSERSAS